MTLELDVLKDVAGKLNKASINYFISGSVAMSFYAQPRMTRDIDIVVVLTRRDVSQFVDLFKDEYYIDPDTVDEEVKRGGMFNVINNQSIVKIDFILKKESEFSEEQFKNVHPMDIEGIKIQVISPENLVLSKLLWAKDSLSETQLRDVRNIIENVKPLNIAHIERWVKKLGLVNIYSKVKK